MSDYWISPNKINYTIRQIVFVLSHFSEISLGEWPPQGKDSGYTEAPIKRRKVFYKRTKENIMSIWAVIDMKLKPTGFDGSLAVELFNGTYCDTGLLQIRLDELGKKYNLTQQEIQDKTDTAITFASRQLDTYDNFKERFLRRRYNT